MGQKGFRLMTITECLSYVRSECPTISIIWKTDVKEYRVAYKRALCLNFSDQENSAYYTNDAEDAYKTAKHMHEQWGKAQDMVSK